MNAGNVGKLHVLVAQTHLPQSIVKDLLERAINEHGPFLLKCCVTFCKRVRTWRVEAEDIYQGTFCNVANTRFDKWPPITVADEWRRWLREIAWHWFLDQCKAARRREARERLYGCRALERWARNEPDAPSVDERRLLIEHILENDCSELMRQVVPLRLAMTPYRRIAAIMGISPDTARLAWHEAKRILRRKLKARGG